MHANQADFFQPGHTYRSSYLHMGEAVWLFRCTQVTHRHSGGLIAHGPGYWGDANGKAVPGTGQMTVSYTADSWSGGWTDIAAVEATCQNSTAFQEGEACMGLPHDGYITAVTDHLATYNITVTGGGTSENDDLLDGWIHIDPASISADAWPHGVYLGWDQRNGWTLIEQGGGRNVDPLDPTAVRTYSSPQQVACSAANALRGRLSTGPITNDGTWSWDSRPLEAAVKAWAADEF